MESRSRRAFVYPRKKACARSRRARRKRRAFPPSSRWSEPRCGLFDEQHDRPRPSRRALVLGALGSLLVPSVASARGRTPIGGKFSMRVPFPLQSIDPHRLEDATCAIFDSALFDTLYAHESSGQIVPSLAEAEPEPDGASL